MIDEPSLKELTENTSNLFTLVIMASKRARNLNNGGEKLLEEYNGNKVVSKSLEEIAEGKLEIEDESPDNS